MMHNLLMKENLIRKNISFRYLFIVQFLGALNDNIFKNALVLLIAFKSAEVFSLTGSSLVAFASGIFILPFFLFSPLTGQICDKYPKTKIIRISKLLEFFVMLGSCIAFYIESFPFLLLMLFFMGCQSTLFGPAKYSILPEIVKMHQLTKSNAQIEMGTFLAILVGTICGGVLVFSSVKLLMIILILVSLMGILCSLYMPMGQASNKKLKISLGYFSQVKKMYDLISSQLAVSNSILGISWFWFFGAALLSLLPIYSKDFLMASPELTTFFLALFTLGIGLGSLVCEKLSRHRIEIGLVPIGTLGMSIFLADFIFTSGQFSSSGIEALNIKMFLSEFIGMRLSFDLGMISFFGGVFIVPLYALIQERSAKETLSQVIAGNNILNAFFMVLASLMLIAIDMMGYGIMISFSCLLFLNIIISLYIYLKVPEFTLRFIAWILCNLFYKIEFVNVRNIPSSGAAILAGNHISFIDWLVVFGASPRPLRFIMYYKFFKIPVIKHLMKQANVIPIAGKNEDKKILLNAFDTIKSELDTGELVCIFPEGKITYDGNLSEFKPGILRMLENNKVDVVPFAIQGLWESVFSRNSKKKFPYRFRKNVKVIFGEPIKSESFDLVKLKKEISTLGSLT